MHPNDLLDRFQEEPQGAPLLYLPAIVKRIPGFLTSFTEQNKYYNKQQDRA